MKKHTLLELKDLVVARCSRERATMLIQLLESAADRLEKAPASTATRFHHAYDGGLVDHIHEVAQFALEITSGLMCPEGVKMMEQSVVTVAILHDLGKIGDGQGNPQYVPNILKNGKQSDAIPYEKDKDKCRKYPMPSAEVNHLLSFAEFSDGEASLALLADAAPLLLADLTESEVNAIRYHDGGYGKAKYAAGYQGKEDALAIIIHAADMLSSRARNNEPQAP